jgi:hypothetical protein
MLWPNCYGHGHLQSALVMVNLIYYCCPPAMHSWRDSLQYFLVKVSHSVYAVASLPQYLLHRR